MTSKQILDLIVQYFPGLIDGETEVNGAELVDQLTVLLKLRFRVNEEMFRVTNSRSGE